MSSCCSNLSPEGNFKVFEVQLRRSASAGNLGRESWSDYGDGYVSEDLEPGRRRRKGVPKKPVNSDRHTNSQKFTDSVMPTELASAGSINYRRQYSTRETRKEIRSNLFDIVEDEDNFDANGMPFLADTESPTFLLPGTTNNQEAYYRSDGSSRKVNSMEGDDIHCSVDSNGTEYYSCMDTELCEMNSGIHEAHQRKNNPCRKVALKWFLVICNFFFEVLSVIFDQLASPHVPFYALLALFASFATMVVCMIEIIDKGRQEKVSWRTRGKIYWFYHPSPSHKPFGTFKDVFALVCAFLQVVSAAISYTFYCLHVNSPIKISFCSLAFAVCLLCSNFCNDRDKVSLS